jgi:hypothetical protein
MSDAITPRFKRKPYTVSYLDLKGEKQTVVRRPPLKAHPMLPTDIVSLKIKRSDDFPEDEELTIKHIPEKHSNTLQLVNDEGQTTFVDYFDVELEEEVAARAGVDPIDKIANNKYLMWP